MITIAGMDKFGSTILAPAISLARRTLVALDRADQERLVIPILQGLETPPPQPLAVSPNDQFIVKCLSHFTEIQDAVTTIETIVSLARLPPPRAAGVDPVAHLRLLIEAWLNEVYILSLRCRSFLTFLNRAYRQDRYSSSVTVRIGRVRQVVHDALKPLIQVRGAHVHETRHHDFDLGRLVSLGLLAPADEQFAALFKRALRDTRRDKIEWMIRNNSEIWKLLDDYFETLVELMTGVDDGPRYPSRLTKV